MLIDELQEKYPREKMIKLIERGTTIKQLCKMMHCSKTTVIRLKRIYGLIGLSQTTCKIGSDRVNTGKYVITLCEACSRASADQCWFMRLQDANVGFARMGIKEGDYEVVGVSNNDHVYRIKRCPYFKSGKLSVDRDALPPIAERRKYEITELEM